MAQRGLGQPYGDALETAALLESGLLAKEDAEMHPKEEYHATGIQDFFAASANFLKVGTPQRRTEATVERDIENAIERFGIGGDGASRIERLPPQTRGWTPTGFESRRWRSSLNSVSQEQGALDPVEDSLPML
eukprot:COSAG01_NODE_7108_length_3350_cov_2.665026_2_plen_133_part_00